MGGREKRSRMSKVALLAVASITLFACITASPAAATKVHVYSHSFGAGKLALTRESGIAVNRETAELYVADTEHSRIAKFTGAGTEDGKLASIADPTSIAVDNSTGPSKGDIYVVEGDSTVSKLDPTGALVTGWGTGGHLGGLSEILGIAVDPAGNLWVFSQTLTVPTEDILTARTYDQDGTLVTSPSTWSNKYAGNFRAPLMPGIAVDASGNLYTILGHYTPAKPEVTFVTRLWKFGPAGEALSEGLNTFESAGVASDPSDEDVYFGREEGAAVPPNLFRYSSGGKLLETFGGEYEGPVNQPLTPAEAERLQSVASIAVEKNGSVFAADWEGGQISAYELEEVTLPSATIEPVDSVTKTSAHVVGHINPNAVAGSPPSHNVAWEFQCTPACPGHSGILSVESDGSERTVEATIGGLNPGTEYSVLLVAKNRAGDVEAPPNPNPGQPNPGESFTTEAAEPAVTDNPVSEVFSGGATFNAEINPNGAETTYHFEYMPAAAFKAEKGFSGAQVQRTPESSPLEPGAMIHQISVRVAGLASGVAYVYRAVAVNSVGIGNGEPVEFRAQIASNPPEPDCPNQALRTGAGARLPDCRGYEMVTPIEKNGSLVESYLAGLQAAPDGSGVTWFTGQTATGIPSPQGAHQGYAFYLSTLAGESWTSQRLLAPEQLGDLSSLVGLTEDGRYALIQTAHSIPETVPGLDRSEPALYLLDTADHALTTVVPPQVGKSSGPRAFSLDGASADDSLIFFESHLSLAPNAAPEKNNVYVWSRQTGAVSLAGVLPGSKGEAPPGGSFGGAYLWAAETGSGSTEAGGAEEALYVEPTHALSQSGDALYFTAGKAGQIYLRRGFLGAKQTTVRVSVANPGVTDPNPDQPSAFQEATPNGAKAFFISNEKLTQDANTGPTDEGSDLYRYDAEAKTLVDVTPDPVGAGARVQGLLGAAEDGSSGYLVAKGVLAEGGTDGQSNLYHFAEAKGGGFTYKWIATLSPSSSSEYERIWSPSANRPRTARVSQDGSTVIFMSARPLNGAPSGACIYGLCMQLYRYSTSEGVLACLSCNPTGEASMIGAELTSELAGALVPENHVQRQPGVGIYGNLPANLSASGGRVFFQSSEPLLPEDVNGTDPHKNCTSRRTCVDVYEWEAVGTGRCRVPNQAGGCLYLLSTGESGQASYFVNASTDGSSAFIITSSQLVPADQDELTDVYDVRVDGGLAAQHAPPSGPCNSSELCKGAPPAPPQTALPGSATFQGPGNPSFKKCKKGQVLKHDKCVKKTKKHKKSKQQKKHRPTGKKSSGGAK